MAIHYFSEDTNLKVKNKKKISNWLLAIIQQENYKIIQLNFIFCSDLYLHAKNKAYLGHDTFTDVLTFDYATVAKTIWGDIYISTERVEENAKNYVCTIQEELYRVMVHGLLHLLPYNDQTIEERNIMRKKESFYLAQLLSFLPSTR